MVPDRPAGLLVQCLAGRDRELKDDSVAAQSDSSTCELWLLYHLQGCQLAMIIENKRDFPWASSSEISKVCKGISL